MRLVNVKMLTLQEFFGTRIPHYAILSHRWEDEEVTYQDLLGGRGPQMKGWSKIAGCCKQAIEDGLEYAVRNTRQNEVVQNCWLYAQWIDSCCIDKSSNAELSEAINSMFRWYQRSEICYAYLSDVELALDNFRGQLLFGRSKWFMRGWTLKEILAPDQLVFFV